MDRAMSLTHLAPLVLLLTCLVVVWAAAAGR
jgi:hypothetical protein